MTPPLTPLFSKTTKAMMTKEEAENKAVWLKELNASGYAGILPTGQLVDRREHPKAIPVQANSMFGVVKPKKLSKP